MTKVGTGGVGTELYSKANELKKDGKIDKNDLDQLNKIAQKNGITNQEKKFLASLSSKQEVKEVKSSKTSSVQMEFPDKDSEYNELSRFINNKPLLDALNKSGTLNKKDSQGKTILQNIKEMTNSKMQGTVDGKKLAEETIAILGNRTNILQGPHGTCGAGSVQNLVWTQDPAEMVRIVKDLAKDGKVVLRDGKEMLAGTDSLNFHNGDTTKDGSVENRTDFDIIFQSAVMKDQAFLADFTDYNVKNDLGDGKSVLTGDSASDPYKVKNLMQSITGEHYQTNMFDFDVLQEKVAQGKEVIACYLPDTEDKNWGMHYVTVTAIKDGEVYFQNTQTGANTELNHMPIEEFKNKLLSVVSKDDTKTGETESEDGFTGKVIESIPFVLGGTAIVAPALLPFVAPPLLATYIAKKGGDIVKAIPKIPAKIKQSVVDANNRTKEAGFFKDEKGNKLTAKQSISSIKKETEARVFKNTKNKNAAKVASKTAGALQTVVASSAVVSVMVSNKIKKTGAGIEKFGRSASGMSKLTNHRADIQIKSSGEKGISTGEKIKRKATGYGLKVVSKGAAVTGYVAQKAGKAISYAGGKMEKATGAVVQASKPVIDAVSNTVGNIYSGASSAASSIRSYFSWR